ncbi:hypothetical protein [Treponema brennaborense]|uniref:DUF4384 domain-containing protein n=1 Tax=Treponema brennaborense (strain DSM 12168 / CIP 105900 / DD5/3) TaxID=906968 RepID=F4LKV5_TREBD|nr:hypothetical protein [Treponema brennaborense]AEE16552.1 hypothetical protein Trebr_1120 [Treponema brennaborense DSM 12168]
MKDNAFTYERIRLGELSGGGASAEYLRRLEESDREILAAYPAHRMEPDVQRKRFRLHRETEVKRRAARHMFLSVCVPAAAAAVLVAAVSLGIQSRTADAAASPDKAAAIRVKGAAQNALHLYKQNGDGIVRLKNRDSAAAGDLIQISYVAAGGYGAIFSIDGNGIVTRHFPDTDVSAELSAGKEIPLDFSYELDDAPVFERFVFVTAEKPFSVRQITAALRKEHPADIMTSDLSECVPQNAAVSDMLILK